MNCLSNFKQINIYEQFQELKSFAKSKPAGFVQLLKTTVDLKTFIPSTFIDAYIQHTNNNSSVLIPYFFRRNQRVLLF